jgi:hypothetical protein
MLLLRVCCVPCISVSARVWFWLSFAAHPCVYGNLILCKGAGGDCLVFTLVSRQVEWFTNSVVTSLVCIIIVWHLASHCVWPSVGMCCVLVSQQLNHCAFAVSCGFTLAGSSDVLLLARCCVWDFQGGLGFINKSYKQEL